MRASTPVGATSERLWVWYASLKNTLKTLWNLESLGRKQFRGHQHNITPQSFAALYDSKSVGKQSLENYVEDYQTSLRAGSLWQRFTYRLRRWYDNQSAFVSYYYKRREYEAYNLNLNILTSNTTPASSSFWSRWRARRRVLTHCNGVLNTAKLSSIQDELNQLDEGTFQGILTDVSRKLLGKASNHPVILEFFNMRYVKPIDTADATTCTPATTILITTFEPLWLYQQYH